MNDRRTRLICRHHLRISPQGTLKRFVVHTTQFTYGSRHDNCAIYPDFHAVWNSFADRVRRELVLPRYFFDSSNTGGVAREHHPAGVFAKQHKLGGYAIASNIHAETDRVRKGLFRQSHGKPAVRAIVRRIHQAGANDLDYSLLQRRLSLQLESWGIAPYQSEHRLGILGRTKLGLYVSYVPRLARAQ